MIPTHDEIENFKELSEKYIVTKESLISFIVEHKKLVPELKDDDIVMDLLGGVKRYLQTVHPNSLCKYASTIVEIKNRGGKSLGHSKSLLQAPRRKRIQNSKKRV